MLFSCKRQKVPEQRGGEEWLDVRLDYNSVAK